MVGDILGSRSRNGRAGDEAPWKSRGCTAVQDYLLDSRYFGAISIVDGPTEKLVMGCDIDSQSIFGYRMSYQP